MLVHFIHPGSAYLPELAAYSEFLATLGHGAQVHAGPASVPADAAIVWWMCGRVPHDAARRFARAFQIHEYASASVPPWAWMKDRAKRALQPMPQYRIFQNAWVQARLGFADGVPHEFRDMGVAQSFFSAPSAVPEFDGVYLGDMQRLRRFVPLLASLKQAGQHTLLIGEPPADLRATLQPLAHITGRVPHGQVPALLRRARYGLNLVPDQLPYSQQTSTKLLEYCAAGLPVVSTGYAWVRAFEARHGARFAYLPALDVAACQVPDVSALAWPRVLERLALWRRLGLCS
ncbi:MAG: glycosyltransferase [Acidovorax sp.]